MITHYTLSIDSNHLGGMIMLHISLTIYVFLVTLMVEFDYPAALHISILTGAYMIARAIEEKK